MKRFSVSAVAGMLFSAAAANQAHAEAPFVVADVAPIHSLVAQVMAGVGEPHLLIPAKVSPHGYSLKVSQARVLNDADLVFWVGETLTPWLEKALETLADDAKAIELLNVEEITLLGADEEEDEDGHEEESHDEDEHHHGDADPHIWLDPENAAVLITAIAEALAEADAENAEVYRRNAEAARGGLAALSTEVGAQMESSSGLQYVVFHDGYRYFEHRFGLGRAIAITGGHAAKPGARRLSEVRQIMRDTPTRCVFAERQFGSKSVDAIVRGSEARKAELDPMGESLAPGPDLYAGLIRALANSFSACLKPE